MAFSDNNPGWNMDYSGQLNEMLAPYQKMSQTLSSPYATMRPDSWLAQNHPKAAGVLDNAFLTVGMTPGPQGPEGVGGGISRTFQGLIGAQQYRRQQALTAAMLPYQMLEPRLRAMDTIAQMQQRGEQADYERKRGAWYDARIGQMKDPHALGKSMTDDKGGEWQEIFDPVGGKTRLFNPITQQHADELPQDQQPSFTKSQRMQRTSTPGGLAGEIIDAQMSGDPMIRARGEKEAKLYTGLMGGVAGGRKGGEENAPHPWDEAKMTLDNERKSAYANLKPPMDAQKFHQSLPMEDPRYAESFNSTRPYDEYLSKHQMEKDQLDFNFNQYQKSGAWKRGVGFQDWQKDPNKGGSQDSQPAPSNKPPNW
jgi:hypothetical protein